MKRVWGWPQLSAALRGMLQKIGRSKREPFSKTDKAKETAQDPELIRQIRAAHMDWVCAQHRLNIVVEKDEIDFAIFVLEAAEKRYGMLLKEAKLRRVSGYGAYPPVMERPTRVMGG